MPSRAASTGGDRAPPRSGRRRSLPGRPRCRRSSTTPAPAYPNEACGLIIGDPPAARRRPRAPLRADAQHGRLAVPLRDRPDDLYACRRRGRRRRGVLGDRPLAHAHAGRAIADGHRARLLSGRPVPARLARATTRRPASGAPSVRAWRIVDGDVHEVALEIVRVTAPAADVRPRPRSRCGRRARRWAGRGRRRRRSSARERLLDALVTPAADRARGARRGSVALGVVLLARSVGRLAARRRAGTCRGSIRAVRARVPGRGRLRGCRGLGPRPPAAAHRRRGDRRHRHRGDVVPAPRRGAATRVTAADRRRRVTASAERRDQRRLGRRRAEARAAPRPGGVAAARGRSTQASARPPRRRPPRASRPGGPARRP